MNPLTSDGFSDEISESMFKGFLLGLQALWNGVLANPLPFVLILLFVILGILLDRRKSRRRR